MREISVIKGRILQYLESKGITKYTFYKVTGVANGILSQPNGISEDTLQRFLRNYEEVNGDWLLRGVGPMLRTGAYPAYPASGAADQNQLHDTYASYNGKGAPQRAAEIPVADLSAAAEAETAFASAETIRIPDFMPERGFYLCFRTEGEAMCPTLQEGGYIVCRLLPEEEWTRIDDGSVCVLVTQENKCYVRRVRTLPVNGGGFTALADNGDTRSYPALRFDAEDLRRIWKVEWYLTPSLTPASDPRDKKVRFLEEEVNDLKHRVNRLLPPQK